jgi:diadenosine tetraphosphate (Ap4A) HIT family hydrolase
MSAEGVWTAIPIIMFLRNMAAKVARGRSRTEPDIKPAGRAVDDCIFCQRDDKRLNKIVRENATFYARYDNFPAAAGHLEVVPKRHVESLFELTPDEVFEAYSLLCEVQKIVTENYRPDGYTIGVNEGPAAGQSIAHLHIHLIPRHHGDVSDPRGGIRQAVPNWDPDSWTTDADPGR